MLNKKKWQQSEERARAEKKEDKWGPVGLRRGDSISFLSLTS